MPEEVNQILAKVFSADLTVGFFYLQIKDKMNILVTGGYGFIGSHLVTALLNLKHEVTILNNTGDEINCHFDVCFHQAANNDTTDMDVAGMNEANVVKPKLLFNKLLQLGCKQFVYASSTAILQHLILKMKQFYHH